MRTIAIRRLSQMVIPGFLLLRAGTQSATVTLTNQPLSGAESDPGALLTYSGITPIYARAITRIASTARDVYAEKFHCDMPPRAFISATKNPVGRTSLWNDGESHLFLTVRSMNDLLPPSRSGVF